MTIVKDIFFQMRLSRIKFGLQKELKELVNSMPEIQKDMSNEEYTWADKIARRCNTVMIRYSLLNAMSW